MPPQDPQNIKNNTFVSVVDPSKKPPVKLDTPGVQEINKPAIFNKHLIIVFSVFVMSFLIALAIFIPALEPGPDIGDGLMAIWILVMITIPSFIATIVILIQNSIRVRRAKKPKA